MAGRGGGRPVKAGTVRLQRNSIIGTNKRAAVHNILPKGITHRQEHQQSRTEAIKLQQDCWITIEKNDTDSFSKCGR